MGILAWCFCFAQCLLLLLVSVEADSYDRSQHAVDPEVFIPNLGHLRGFWRKSYFQKRNISCFLGINYAIAPSGKRRFQPPEPFPSWSGVYNATKFRQRCPQLNTSYYPPIDPSLVDTKQDEEDCLVLNVFSPKLPKNDNDRLLPVMLYIHGGSFYAGSAQDFLPDFLLEKDMLLVVPQYRLGPLGYACLHTNDIPGNVGYLDMIEALKWVQRNIVYFGGDPRKVTVVGQSAGAAAVTALLVSSLVTPDLFAKMIVMSGSALATWTHMEDPIFTTVTIAHMAGCYSNNLQEISDCLRKIPVSNLLQAHMEYVYKFENGSGVGCGMVLQKAGEQKFLVESPSAKFERGEFLKVPIMAGTTRDEGTAFLASFYNSLGNNAAYLRRNITRDVLKFCGIEDQTGSMVDYLQHQYFNEITSLVEICPTLVDIVGVLLMKASTYDIARHMSVFQPTYMYSFNYPGNVSKLAASEPSWDSLYPFPTGVAHSDDLGYLFPMNNHIYTNRELKMVPVMTDLWTNFVIKSQPGPTQQVKEWNTVQDPYGPYLRIDDYFRQYPSVYKEFEVARRDGFINRSISLGINNILICIAVIILLVLKTN